MKVSGRFVDKSIFVVIYTAVALLVVMGAHRLTDYTIDLAFYQDYLVPWEVSLMAWRQKQIEWKTDDGHDPVAYMQDLVLQMQAKGLQPPQSNTARAYVYRLNRFGAHARQILLVYKDGRIILYGLPPSSFERLDRFIDGHSDPQSGEFTGQWSSDQVTRIAQWHI